MNNYGLKQMAFGTPGTSVEATPREPYILSEKQKADLKKYFEHFDFERNGILDKLELQYLMNALDFPMKSKQIDELVKSLGPEAAERGAITLEQFEAIMAEQYSLQDPDEELRKGFRLMDTDSTGIITKENLREMSKYVDEEISEDVLEDMITAFDIDKDGGLNIDEYLSIFEHRKVLSKKMHKPKDSEKSQS